MYNPIMIKSKPKTRKISRTEIGFVLIAKPFWGEEYNRSVVLVIDHNPEYAVGIIVNKQSNLTVDKAIDIKLPLPLYYGGPVKKDLVMFLHTNKAIPDTIPVGNGLYMGGDFEALKELLLQHRIDPRRIRFVAGSVYWGPGQLEEEIKDKWWVGEMGTDYFDIKSEDLWKEKLLEDNHVYGMLDEYPDPSLS